MSNRAWSLIACGINKLNLRLFKSVFLFKILRDQKNTIPI